MLMSTLLTSKQWQPTAPSGRRASLSPRAASPHTPSAYGSRHLPLYITGNKPVSIKQESNTLFWPPLSSWLPSIAQDWSSCVETSSHRTTNDRARNNDMASLLVRLYCLLLTAYHHWLRLDFKLVLVENWSEVIPGPDQKGRQLFQ